jgi:hypothetical protein
LPDVVTSPTLPADEKPERRWSDSQLAAVVEAAYILEVLGR